MTLKLRTILTVATISATTATFAHAAPASAAALTWNLHAQFIDGGTATGAFDYDATSGVFSAFNIKTLVGSSALSSLFFAGTTYSPAGFTGSVQNGSTTLELIGAERSLKALFSAPLTEAGGTISLVPEFSFEKLQFQDGLAVTRDVASGTVTASTTAIPTPALLPGLIGLGMGVLRQKRKATQAKMLG